MTNFRIQKEYQSKEKDWGDIHKELISIIELFPNYSPNDFLINHSGLTYTVKNFQGVIDSLDHKIEYLEEQLDIIKHDQEKFEETLKDISEIKETKRIILEIDHKYGIAINKYNLFFENNKEFNDYVGEKVKKERANFNGAIKNAFEAGWRSKDDDNSGNSTILEAKKLFISSIEDEILEKNV